jgi:hypothetical protein
MNRIASLLGISVLALVAPVFAQGRGERPAPPPSRYSYTIKYDLASLPAGVTLREAKNGALTQWFIANSGETPLVIHERFQGETLVSGTKLVSGKVYQYFPNGVPMEGKTHLKGWQAPFGEIKETLLYLPNEPAKIYEGRKPGLSKDLPPPEVISIPAKYGDKAHDIKGTVQYQLNEAYDAFYKDKDTEKK